MDIENYKEKKLDKLTRDAVQLANRVSTFGYGESVDSMAKNMLTNYMLGLIQISELHPEIDFEILTQSLSDEIRVMAINLSARVFAYKRDLNLPS